MSHPYCDILHQAIWEVTGMELDSSLPLKWTEGDGEVHLQMGDLEIAFSPVDEEPELEEEIRQKVEDYENEIRRELVQHRLEMWDEVLLPKAAQTLQKTLQDQQWEGNIDDLDLSTRDFGHFPQHHSDMEEEYTRGWPELGLELSFLGAVDIEPVGVSLDFDFQDPDWVYIEDRVDFLTSVFLEKWREKSS